VTQSGQSPKNQIYSMMVLFRSGILCLCWKNLWTPIWNLYAPWAQWSWSGQSPKIQVCHDGALSIRKLILNKAQLIISLFVNWRTTKKCAPYFRGNMEFPFYSCIALIDYDWLVTITNIVTNGLMYKHTNGRTKLSKKVFKKFLIIKSEKTLANLVKF
jgi:hypothetical protein